MHCVGFPVLLWLSYSFLHHQIMPVCICKFQIPKLRTCKNFTQSEDIKLVSPNVFTVPLEATNALIGYIWKLVLKLHQSHATSVGHVVIFDPGIFHQERRGYSSRKNGGHCQEGKPGKQPHPWNPMPTVKGKNIFIISWPPLLVNNRVITHIEYK